jgi:hypothetical protein
MRRRFRDHEGAIAGDQTGAFFHGTENVYRKPLARRFINVRRAEKTNRVFPVRQPVHTDPPVSEQRDIHLAVETLNKFLADFWTVIKKPHGAVTGSGPRDVARDDFPFPLRIDEVPNRFEIVFFRQLGVVGDRAVLRIAGEFENKLILRVSVEVFATPPFRSSTTSGRINVGFTGSSILACNSSRLTLTPITITSARYLPARRSAIIRWDKSDTLPVTSDKRIFGNAFKIKSG